VKQAFEWLQAGAADDDRRGKGRASASTRNSQVGAITLAFFLIVTRQALTLYSLVPSPFR
jgi:hypothetical protein